MKLSHSQIRENMKMVKRNVKGKRSDGTIYPVCYGRLYDKKKK
jgi:hypothetical protein